MHSTFTGSDKLLFISDVHLGAFSSLRNRKIEHQLINLLDFAESNSYRMVVLGDLFDYWIEYPGFVPNLGRQLRQRFEAYHRRMGPSLYITGNHDYWTLGHFADIGSDVEPTSRIITIGKERIFLAHGDAIGPGPGQLQRSLIHRMIRSDYFLNLYRRIFRAETGLKIMKEFSSFSRRTGGKTDPSKRDKWAQNLLKNNEIDYILCGHDHVPRRCDLDYGTYLNLGTFYHHKSLVKYNNGKFSIVIWQDNQRQLQSLKS